MNLIQLLRNSECISKVDTSLELLGSLNTVFEGYLYLVFKNTEDELFRMIKNE